MGRNWLGGSCRKSNIGGSGMITTKGLIWIAAILGCLLIWSAAIKQALAVDLTYVLAHASAYAPPPCNADPCVLTGPGGIVQVWNAHIDKNIRLGRHFVVKGVCASACAIAAQRAHATLLPGAQLIHHQTSPANWK